MKDMLRYLFKPSRNDREAIRSAYYESVGPTRVTMVITLIAALTFMIMTFAWPSYFGGTTDLEIMVKKSIEYIDDTNKKRKTALKDVNYKAILGLVMLVITDIVNGYVAIGGQTAVGRGLFEGNGEIRISEAGLTEAECRRALYQYLQEVRRCR